VVKCAAQVVLLSRDTSIARATVW